MKDRIGNELTAGDKVLVALPEAQIFGFLSLIEEPGLIAVRGSRTGTEHIPGRVLVSCVIAIPLSEDVNRVMQVVKVHDPDKHEDNPPPDRLQ